jgi:hypothetical protein
MKIIRHHDSKTFADQALPMLLRNEALNNWMVGLTTDLCGGVRKIPTEQLLLLEVQDDRGEPIAAAASTGEALVLSRMDQKGLNVLTDFLHEHKIQFDKAAGPADTVGAFSSMWGQRTGLKPMVGMGMLIMQLEKVARS